jgi:hypothetical protein
MSRGKLKTRVKTKLKTKLRTYYKEDLGIFW